MEQQTHDPFLGKVLSGRYEILAPLGAGGMGRVYRAVQHPLDRLVALKVLDPHHDRARDPGFEKRFLLEASATAKLRHPNTVTVHDYGRSEDGVYYIAMELVEGETLRQVLSKRGPLPWPRALVIGAQVARSLREAHRLGLVHRDLKPANIMLLATEDGDDAVKVLDFGLVKDFTLSSGEGEQNGELAEARVLIGSPLFVSPEQIRNQADPRSDIYSLGIVLFQAISGRTPFTGDDPYDLFAKHLRERPPQLKDLAAVPAEVNDLVMKCLEKARTARFQSMDELLQAMRRIPVQGLSGVFSVGASVIVPIGGAASALLPAPCAPDPRPSPVALAEAGAPAPRRAILTRRRLPLVAGGAGVAAALLATAVWALARAELPNQNGELELAGESAAAPSPNAATPPPQELLQNASEPRGAVAPSGVKVVGIEPLDLTRTLEGERGEPVRRELGSAREGPFRATRAVHDLEDPPRPALQERARRPVFSPPLAPVQVRAPAPSPPPSQMSPTNVPTFPEGYKDNPYQ